MVGFIGEINIPAKLHTFAAGFVFLMQETNLTGDSFAGIQ